MILCLRVTGLESGTKTPLKLVIVNRLAEITDDSIFQGAVPINLIWISSNENGRDRIPGICKMLVQFDSRHSRHVDVGDQAVGVSDVW